MILQKLTCEPGALLNFFEDGLRVLGAVTERTWHDRLQILAEGKAAKLWNPKEDLIETELLFPAREDTGARDAAREAFPGCPLTFHLAEALWGPLAIERVQIRFEPQLRPPSTDSMARSWQQQFAGIPYQPIGVLAQDWSFSILASVRCEIQAIDQHWSLHRLAISLPDGALDDDLALKFDFAEAIPRSQAQQIAWLATDLPQWSAFLGEAAKEDLAPQLAPVQRRQELYLKRELERIDTYFANYERESLARRSANKERSLKLDDRLAAAHQEHQRRRDDQLHRHQITIVPHIDSLLLVTEPAWKTTIPFARTEPEPRQALFVHRSRRWKVSKPHS
jgi:hypothetical protein